MKVIVLVAVVSLIVLAKCQYSPDWDTSKSQNSLTDERTEQPYMGNARPHNGQNQHEKGQFGRTFMMTLSITTLLGISIILLVKCYQKRSGSGKIKDEMMIKRHQYATNLGLTSHQLSIQYPTVHI